MSRREKILSPLPSSHCIGIQSAEWHGTEPMPISHGKECSYFALTSDPSNGSIPTYFDYLNGRLYPGHVGKPESIKTRQAVQSTEK